MNPERFNEIVEEQFSICGSVLVKKAYEYAPNSDRLVNFRKAANLQSVSMAEALGGMFAKHVISIFDMLENADKYGYSLWEEKITDAINYLVLLKAVVYEYGTEAAKAGTPMRNEAL